MRWSRTTEAFLLNPQPLAARTAQEWGVVAEVVPNGKASVGRGIGRAVPEGSGSDTPQHARAFHPALEGAHRSRSLAMTLPGQEHRLLLS